MLENLQIILVIVIATLAGVYLGRMRSKYKEKEKEARRNEREDLLNQTLKELTQEREDCESKIEHLRVGKEALQNELTEAKTNLHHLKNQLEEKKRAFEDGQEQQRKDFLILANEVLKHKSSEFTQQNKENIKQILEPLKEKIKDFEDRVEGSQKESIKMHSALKEQLHGLKELNQQMSKEASNLTQALKGDSKTQGNWGELVLERVLEKSGLEKNREYVIQQAVENEHGSRAIPDVVIQLPDKKKMVIDSKVSLTDYQRFIETDEEVEKTKHLKAHIQSVRKHVTQLSEKKYQTLFDDSPDFVLMFVPNEPAFAMALNEDHLLYDKAFEKNIVIVTPTTLLATLRTIDSMWRNEKQKKNALEIATQAGYLYDSFSNLMDELIKLGKQLGTVTGTYEAAMKKLTGRNNLIKRVEKLKQLGAKASKEIDHNLLKRAQEDES